MSSSPLKRPAYPASLPKTALDFPTPEADAWWYARTNYSDHFAEHYTKAILVPETLHEDLVARPERDVEQNKERVQSLEAALSAVRNLPIPASDFEGLEQDLEDEREELEEARSARDARRAQYDIMREEIFQAPAAVAAAESRLRAGGASEDTIEAFRADAARAHTDDQVEVVFERYR